jgi:hypothetical protein
VNCEECGFDYDALAAADAPSALRELGRRYRAPLTRFLPGEDPGAIVRARPAPEVWSALEYACHLRDVLDVQRQRLALALVEDCPSLTPMGRDERVTADRYNEQDPTTVAGQLAGNAEALAADVEALDPGQLDRTMIYNYPERQERTVLWLIRHTAHEGHHHLLDVGRSLRAARGR